MALFMDVHTLPPGAGAADLERAHAADLQTQDRFGVRFERYWFDEQQGKAWCLAQAPSAEAARQCHQEAHGLVADEIYEVVEGQ